MTNYIESYFDRSSGQCNEFGEEPLTTEEVLISAVDPKPVPGAVTVRPSAHVVVKTTDEVKDWVRQTTAERDTTEEVVRF